MSGPLRRIARQMSNAAAPRVQAMTRLPYASPPELLPDTSSESDLRAPAQPQAPPQAPMQNDSQAPPEAPASPTYQHPGSRDFMARTHTKTSRYSHAEQLTQAGPAARAPRSPKAAIAPPAPAPSMAAPQSSTAHSPAGAAAAANPNAGADAAPPASAPEVTIKPPGEPDKGPPRTPVHHLSAAPPPLLDPHSTAPSPQTSSQARIAPGMPSPGHPLPAPAAVHATDEVHVHIGRIEVTALQDTPTVTPRRKPKGRQPMSLDDYLAKRQQSQ